MIYIEDIKELEAIIRNILIEQSELNDEFVRNVYSIYGTDLDKNEGDIFTTISHEDCLILFDVSYDTNANNMSEKTPNLLLNSEDYYQYYISNITMYGNASLNLSSKLVARLRTLPVIRKLQDQGVYISSISDITNTKEFKNNSIWMRNDFEISFGSAIRVNNISEDYEFTSYTKLDILKHDEEVENV